MSLTALLLGCIAVLNLSIGVYVYRDRPGLKSNQAFGFMAMALSLWTVSLAVAHYGIAASPWPLRFAFASASLIPIGVITFVQSTPFVPGYEPSRILYRGVLLPAAAILFAASFSPLIVAAVVPSNPSRANYGPLHSVFATYVLICLASAVYILRQKLNKSVGSVRLQVRWLIMAFAVPSALAIATNLAIPLFLHTSTFSKYGPFFTLPLLALIGHLIIHHRLLDVRVVVRRSAVYLACFALAGLVLVGLLVALNSTFMADQSIPVKETVLALGVALLFGPLKNRIQNAANLYFYREPYDYQRTIKEASRALRETIDLPVIFEYVTTLVARTLRSEAVAIYLLDEDGAATYELSLASGHKNFPDALSKTLPLVALAITRRDIIFRDDLVGSTPNQDVEASMFDEIQSEVLVPLIAEEDVIGLLCVSRKLSGDPYFSDDADLLATLANQSAVSIRNAQTHQRVVQLNEELQKILSTIESGVVAIGTKGKIALFNPAAELLTGVEASTARGQRVEHLPAPLATLIAATLADRQPRSQIEFSLPDMSGQVRPLVCSTSPLESPDGRPMGAVAVLNDISILKQLEHQRRQAERLASNEAMASGLVHEIRNPLVAVKTFCQLLPSRYLDVDFRETFSRTVGREVRRIDSLLTRFRTLASVASQPMEPVDVLDPLRHTIELLRPQFDEHKIAIRQVFDGTPRRVLGNTSQLEQLFLNLCLNALEAMGSGGELTLRIADLSDGGGTTLLVEISDTGDGIPDDLLPKIFDPFVSTKARSSGLGLAICRGVADAHHARLGAKNNTDRRGATFTIEFPIPISSPATTP